MGISQNHLATELRIPVPRVHDIVHGRRGISADTAIRLGRYFGTGPEFWYNLQSNYDLFVAQKELEGEISRIVPFRDVCPA